MTPAIERFLAEFAEQAGDFRVFRSGIIRYSLCGAEREMVGCGCPIDQICKKQFGENTAAAGERWGLSHDDVEIIIAAADDISAYRGGVGCQPRERMLTAMKVVGAIQ